VTTVGQGDEPPDTRLLREGQDEGYKRLRTLLSERGMDPDAVALAECYPDDNRVWFGVVVTPEARVYEFDFDFSGPGDIRTQFANGVFSAWDETTERWRDRAGADSVEAALRFLAGDA
jgi:hypothetical protein